MKVMGVPPGAIIHTLYKPPGPSSPRSTSIGFAGAARGPHLRRHRIDAARAHAERPDAGEDRLVAGFQRQPRGRAIRHGIVERQPCAELVVLGLVGDHLARHLGALAGDQHGVETARLQLEAEVRNGAGHRSIGRQRAAGHILDHLVRRDPSVAVRTHGQGITEARLQRHAVRHGVREPHIREPVRQAVLIQGDLGGSRRCEQPTDGGTEDAAPAQEQGRTARHDVPFGSGLAGSSHGRSIPHMDNVGRAADRAARCQRAGSACWRQCRTNPLTVAFCEMTVLRASPHFW